VRSLFSFGSLHGDDIGLALAAAATVMIVLELAKPIWRDRLRF
jgi:Ca2+-transporting ATPase